MFKLTMLGTVLAATALLATAFADETLEQKKIHRTFQDQIDGRLKDANDQCGTRITATTEWDGFDSYAAKEGKGLNTIPIGQQCGDAIFAVADVCRIMKEDGKASVQKRISKYVCRYGGEGKRALDIANGTFTFTVDFKKGTNVTDFRNELMKKL